MNGQITAFHGSNSRGIFQDSPEDIQKKFLTIGQRLEHILTFCPGKYPKFKLLPDGLEYRIDGQNGVSGTAQSNKKINLNFRPCGIEFCLALGIFPLYLSIPLIARAQKLCQASPNSRMVRSPLFMDHSFGNSSKIPQKILKKNY